MMLKGDVEGGGWGGRSPAAARMASSSPVTDDCVDFGNLGPDVIAVAFDQASGNDEALGAAGGFCSRPFPG